MRLSSTRLVFVGAAALVGRSLAFAPHPSNKAVRRMDMSTSPRSSSHLFFFNRNKQDENDKDVTEENEGKEDDKQPFFARFLERMQPSTTEQAENPETNTKESSPPHVTNKKEPKAPVVEPLEKKELTALEKALAMKAQAERMRLEAERMDAQLTLDKIERLEVELKQAKKKGDSVDELQRDMEALQAKMRGEAPKPIISSSTTTPPKSEETVGVTAGTLTLSDINKVRTIDAQQVDEAVFQEKLKEYEKAPDVMKLVLASSVGLYKPNVKDVNATEVALRFEMMQRDDYSFLGDVSEPVLSKEQIEKVKKNPLFRASCKLEGLDEDEVARQVLVYEHYSKIIQKQLESSMEEEPLFQMNLLSNATELDQMAESLFPKACRKEGETPTMAQANILVADILPKAGFNPSGKPEPIEGGYIIRGTNKLDNGDALVDSIDEKLQKSSIGGKLSIFYVNDFTVFTEESNFIPGDEDPILLVTGPNVYREPRRLLYSAVSAFGIASSWYLSIYPFLLNSDLMKRAEEQMSLADSNMAYDLTWLTDLSLPLFLTFMGIQLTHEIGHRAVAAAYGMNITVPTFVPSLITGITSTVTTFKSPPKNREAMFDFSIAGPFAGIIASVVALYFGLQFTLYSTTEAAAQFPALPLEILRQSTLGGGIVEFVLGAGALAVPGGSEGTSAISSITIPLHPVAIAGYISLIVNSLALLPIGTTDGGRIAMTLFSRGAKLVVSQLFLIVLFTLGIFGSDLFLFYFSFLIFFQQGNEIPSRNEVDEVSFSRVLLATVAGVISLLALIPIS